MPGFINMEEISD